MSRRMFKLLPRGVAGWTLLILINVLLLMSFAQFVVIKLIGQEVSNFVERDTIADRVFVLDKVLRATPADQWPGLVAAVDQPNFHVSIGSPDPQLLAERERERPLIAIAESIDPTWRKYLRAEALRTQGDRAGAEALEDEARLGLAPIIERLKPLTQSDDPAIAYFARDQINELNNYLHSTHASRLWDEAQKLLAKALSWIKPATPNTAVFVPARSFDMSTEIFVAMELQALRLNQESKDPASRRSLVVAVSAQRVSPFVRAWFGPRFDDRPYLRRAPGNPSALRVVLPASSSQWIVIDAGTAESAVADFTPYLEGFMIAGVLILIVTGWAITRLTAPIARFAEATGRLGRDVNASPLDLSGPSEVRQAAAAFNEMQARIQAYVRDRTTMLAAISHDLRTPLTRLRLRGEFIDEDQQEKYYRDLDEMEAMISACMDFVRDDSRSEETVPVDVASLARALSLDMRDGGKDVTFLYDGGPIAVSVRPLALRRALMNLIENALKYGERARINLFDGTKGVEILIDDDGPGIPEEQREQVFAPFYRLETSRNRKTGGMGLGLATVRSILRSHGGDVTLDNRASEGDTPSGLRVRVFLPH